ncbi:MAG TPA: hypothetical protein EYH59_02390 [Pyrodictium sp.]|nr:hypothetical protein [Pyrodictium sp.]
MGSRDIELELIEEYELLGEKRFRFRIKGTNIIVNVGANKLEEAREKAIKIVEDMRLTEFLKRIKEVKTA